MMTEKELKQEAEDYAKRKGNLFSETYGIRYRAYLDGAEPREKQLTKAKEIIKDLLNSCFGYNSKTINYEVKARAEQFLKEEKEC